MSDFYPLILSLHLLLLHLYGLCSKCQSNDVPHCLGRRSHKDDMGMGYATYCDHWWKNRPSIIQLWLVGYHPGGFWHVLPNTVVFQDRGPPQSSSMLIGFSSVNQPFWGNPHWWKPPSGGTWRGSLRWASHGCDRWGGYFHPTKRGVSATTIDGGSSVMVYSF